MAFFSVNTVILRAYDRGNHFMLAPCERQVWLNQNAMGTDNVPHGLGNQAMCRDDAVFGSVCFDERRDAMLIFRRIQPIQALIDRAQICVGFFKRGCADPWHRHSM